MGMVGHCSGPWAPRFLLGPSSLLAPAFWGREWWAKPWWLYAVLVDVSHWEPLKTVLVPTERQIPAQDSLWGRIWPRSRRVFHPPAPSRVGESLPGHCTLTPVQLWTLMDYK